MWSNAKRPPDSREEDSWLSDEQQRQVAPAETEPFQSPVPTRMVSNGEYMPHPQTEQQKHVEYRIKELADERRQEARDQPAAVPGRHRRSGRRRSSP